MADARALLATARVSLCPPRLKAMLQVTPNGLWGKDVHPNLPVSLDELLTDLRDCFRLGGR